MTNETGLDYSKISMIRQALGRAVMSEANGVPEYKDWATKCLLRSLLCLLGPTREPDICDFIEQILPRAISLRVAMTEEQTIYRPFMCNPGDDFIETSGQLMEGQSPEGKVFLAIFPGLHTLSAKVEGSTSTLPCSKIPVVKVQVMLDSALLRKPAPGANQIGDTSTKSQTSDKPPAGEEGASTTDGATGGGMGDGQTSHYEINGEIIEQKGEARI